MTESNRKLHIVRALQQYEQAPGAKETLTLPLRGGTILPVIELPLDVPLLNHESFRIAPQLDDHPDCELVRADPTSERSQRVIAQLVEEVHRNADALKENLSQEGQQQPGLITRSAKLINGNTRCVLLRQLDRSGKGSTTTIKVAVLSDIFDNRELLEIETVLQQQVELKDSYRLANQLMMIKRLHEAELTDEQIARTLRLNKANGMTAAERVFERREILRLMERARKLVHPPLPMTVFATDADKLQNWQELLRSVKHAELERNNTFASDPIIASWMIAYLTGNNSVHKLRHATGSFIEEHVLEELGRYKEQLQPAGSTPKGPPLEGDSADGLDILGEDTEDPNDAVQPEIRALLNVVARAHQADEHTEIVLPTGETVAAPDLLSEVGVKVKKALDLEKRRSAAGTKLLRPQGHLNSAKTALNDALKALQDVRTDIQFEGSKPTVLMLLQEIQELAGKVAQLVADSPTQEVIVLEERS
ncbi:hypothetical protein SMD20_39790 [Nonomuraea sp. LP-02]|uniref:hypothetical protein n=1 Tax=Nonomuraea sp. LP-02 TaxID=3097960 RepID=UPI002E381E1A|nr:hypothetical protein [Nonomuraea sp. LP-02]MED7930425.1 hypothetical protein [Nonomuraea sp. LP-02]